MSKVFFDIGLSLDGFIAGDNRGPHNPLGDGGTAIHQWMYKQKGFWKRFGSDQGEEDGAESRMIEQVFDRAGAYIMGKRMFEEGAALWPEDLFKAPLFVLTHERREPWIQKGDTAFYFVNDPIDELLEKALWTANGKDVRIQGGAHLIQQYLKAGLVDEFTLHQAPVLLGSGIRLFDTLCQASLKAEPIACSVSPMVNHVTYKVIK